LSEEKERQRRGKPRFRVKVASTIKVRDLVTDQEYKFETLNISATGLFVRADGEMPLIEVDTFLAVWLYPGRSDVSHDLPDLLREGVIEFSARVVHAESGASGFGLEIIEIDQKNQRIFNQFVTRISSLSPERMLF